MRVFCIVWQILLDDIIMEHTGSKQKGHIKWAVGIHSGTGKIK